MSSAEPRLLLSKCRHGTLLHPAKDAYVGRSLALYGEYSEAEMAVFAQIVKPGSVVVEAGANIGSLTLPLARLVGESGRVLAFEPQRLIFQVLCANMALNAIENVHTINAALGAWPGTIKVPFVSYTQATNFGGIGVGGENGETVALATIDSLALQRLTLLKIDVEGAEIGVIEGAADTISRLRPVLFVENDRRQHSPRLITLLWNMGYKLWWHLAPLFNPQNFRNNPDNVFGAIVSANMLCLPAEDGRQVTHMREVQNPDEWWRPEP